MKKHLQCWCLILIQFCFHLFTDISAKDLNPVSKETFNNVFLFFARLKLHSILTRPNPYAFIIVKLRKSLSLYIESEIKFFRHSVVSRKFDF